MASRMGGDGRVLGIAAAKAAAPGPTTEARTPHDVVSGGIAAAGAARAAQRQQNLDTAKIRAEHPIAPPVEATHTGPMPSSSAFAHASGNARFMRPNGASTVHPPVSTVPQAEAHPVHGGPAGSGITVPAPRVRTHRWDTAPITGPKPAETV